MTRDEFLEKISQYPEKSNEFVLDRRLVADKLNLYCDGNKWIYYFYERESCGIIKRFDTESEALECLYNELTTELPKIKLPGLTLVRNFTNIGPSAYFVKDGSEGSR